MAFFLYPHSRTATQTTQTAQSLSPGPTRVEVTPPSRFAAQAPAPLRWVRQAWRWLWDQEAPAPKLAPIGEIRKIRVEFHAALVDMQSAKALQDKVDLPVQPHQRIIDGDMLLRLRRHQQRQRAFGGGVRH